MRWVEKQPIIHLRNDIRIIKKFLLFPVRIHREIRWLEIAYLKQRCTGQYFRRFSYVIRNTWENVDFADPEVPSTDQPKEDS